MAEFPVPLGPADTKQVSGGGSNVLHGNPGGEPAPYNTPGSPDYGESGGGSTVRAE
jgi:hypothetical protein